MKLQPQKVAMTLGIVFAGVHLGWSFLILLGLAQPLMDFIFWAHMLANPYKVTGFTLTQTLTLVIVTFFVGYVLGWVFTKVWNYLHK